MTTDSVRQEKGDVIYRQDAIEVINKLMEIHFDRKVVLGKVWQQIKDLPSAQKKGHWIHETIISPINNMEISLPSGVCSECDIHVEYTSKFCPNCGADMRGEGNEDT